MDDEWVDAMRDTTRVLARAQYAHVETVTGFFRRGVAADLARSGGWHRADEGAAATAVAAVLMRMSEYAVSGLVDVGLALDGLPCTKKAFGVGDLDLARVRAIVDVVTGCHEETRLELDRRLSDLGATCAVPGLRATGRRWAAKLDPDSVSERRKRCVQDRDVRISAARDGMAILDGWLPVEAAQTLANRLADMARGDVCAGDPRTFPQRRADALVALADGTGRLVCGCSLGAECPKAGGDITTAATTSGSVTVQVGVSLETLLGLREWPGYLSGAGAIDAELARTLAKDGRWEWIIAAIDAAATMTNSDAGDDPVAGVPSSDEASADTTEAETTAEPSAPDPACGTGTTTAGRSAATRMAGARLAETGTGRSGSQDPVGSTATAPAVDRDDSTATAADSDDRFESGTGDGAATDSAGGSDVVDETFMPENVAPEQESTGGGPTDTEPPPDPGAGNRSSPTRSARRRTRMSAAARRAIAAACTATIGGWDDPDTEAALRYAWPEKLARWIRARDLTCRFPNCLVPARNCDIDHSIRYDHTDPSKGGRTVRTNAACLCRRHHRLKTDGENGPGGWQVRQVDRRGRLAWTTPTGEVIITDPEGAEFLWPEPDLINPPPPPVPRLTPEEFPYLRAQGDEIAALYGLELADTSAIPSRCDETAEYYEFLSAAHPRREADAIDLDTITRDDDPPPF